MGVAGFAKPPVLWAFRFHVTHPELSFTAYSHFSTITQTALYRGPSPYGRNSQEDNQKAMTSFLQFGLTASAPTATIMDRNTKGPVGLAAGPLPSLSLGDANAFCLSDSAL